MDNHDFDVADEATVKVEFGFTLQFNEPITIRWNTTEQKKPLL